MVQKIPAHYPKPQVCFLKNFEILVQELDATQAPEVEGMAMPVEAMALEATDEPVPTAIPDLEDMEEVLEEVVEENPAEPLKKPVGSLVAVTVQVPLKEDRVMKRIACF